MVPMGWTPKQQPDVMFVAPNTDNNNFDENLLIRLVEDPAPGPGEYLEKILPSLRKSLPGFQEIDRQRLEIDGKPTVALLYTSNASGVKGKGLIYFVSKGQLHAVLTFTSVVDSYEKYLHDFRTAALSFRFASKVPQYEGAPPLTWSVPDGKNVSTRIVNDLKFNPGGGGIMISSATDAENVTIWSAAAGKHIRTLKGHTKYVNAVEYSPDGRFLFSASDDSTIRVWELSTGKQKFKLQREGDEPVTDIALSPDGKQLASCSKVFGMVHLWDAIKGKHLREFGHDSNIVEFDREGKVLAMTKSSSEPFGTNIELWDTATGKLTQTLTGHTNDVTSILFSTDNKTLVSCAIEAIIFWDLMSGKQTRKIPSQSGERVALSPNGKVLAYIESVKVRMLDFATTEGLLDIELGMYPASCLVFSPDGKRLAVGSLGREIRIWDLGTSLPAAATPAKAP